MTAAEVEEMVSWFRGRLDEDERNWAPVLRGAKKNGKTFAARMLREVDACRRILDEVVPDILADEAQIDMEFGVSGDPPQASNAVRLVKLLVWSRADRPGYKREWGPELTRE